MGEDLVALGQAAAAADAPPAPVFKTYPIYTERNPPPDIDWLVDDIISAIGICFFAGGPGTFKTFLALKFAMSVMLGIPFMGAKIMKTGTVGWIAAEGSGHLRRRLRAARADELASDRLTEPRKKVLAGKMLPILWVDEFEPLTNDLAEGWLEHQFTALSKQAQDEGYEPLRVIVIDTLSESAAFKNENDNAEVQAILKKLARTARRLNVLVLLIDHTAKSNPGDMRGGGVKRGSAEQVFLSTVEQDAETGKKTGELYVSKNRGGEDGFFVSFTPRVVEIGEENGKMRTTCVIDLGHEPRTGEAPSPQRERKRAAAAKGVKEGASKESTQEKRLALIEAAIRDCRANGKVDAEVVSHADLFAAFRRLRPDKEGATPDQAADLAKKMFGAARKEALDKLMFYLGAKGEKGPIKYCIMNQTGALSGRV
ncbi:AAA family ATPase [Bosea sp. NPDC055353]